MSHILFIVHARGVHGAESVTVQAIKACAAKEARVTVVVPALVKDQGMEAALQDVPGIRWLALNYRAAGRHELRNIFVGLYNLPAVRTLARYIRNEQVDTIYSCSFISLLGAQAAQMTGVRHIWHWHETPDRRFGWDASMEKRYRSLALQADTILCISQKQLSQWKDSLHIPMENARVVYNPMKRIVPISSDKSDPHVGVRIGFIGHIEKRKNLPLLMRAFEQLHGQYPDTTLWLCGAIGPNDEAYIHGMTALREPVVHILPQTSDVASFYHQIDILVLPSWAETMPLVVLEAMQAGVCVLQTEMSGMNELLEAGKETLFFSPSNEESLLHLLQQCMDAAYRQQIAAAGKTKALQLVTNQSFDDTMIQLLCE